MVNTPTTPASGAATQEAKRREAADTNKSRDEAMAAQNEFNKLDTAAKEARAKADAETDPAKKADANKAAQDAYQKADDARAKAAQAARDAEGHNAEATVLDANVLGYGKHPALPASHHLAQKFGNDPANPRPKANLPEVTDKGMVRLERTTPDSTTPINTECHPDMVGDYLRAGWNRAETESTASPSFAAPRNTASDGTTQVDDRTAKVLDDGRDAGRADRTWQGKNVTVVRAAGQGDQGYDPAKGDQVLVRFEDGTTRVVPRGDMQKRELSTAA